MAWIVIVSLAWIPTLYLIVLTVAALRRGSIGVSCSATPVRSARIRFAIVIPAHNEASHIQDTVLSVKSLSYLDDHYSVWVVANACTDDTATLAKDAGAQVLVYDPPGKGQALDYCFKVLLDRGDWDVILVLDADSVLDSNTLQVLDEVFQAGATASQLRYAVRNRPETIRARLAMLQLASLNGLRPLGRDALGYSAGIFGNGFALARETIRSVPYRAFGIVEDLEYHQRLQEAGQCVRFLDAAVVWAEMPESRRQLATQRARWERGKLALMRQELPSVLRQVLRAPRIAIGRAAELFLPPIGWIVILFALALAFGVSQVRIVAAAGLFALMVHYWFAAHRYKLDRIFWRTLIYAPFYVLEKLWLVVRSFLNDRKLGWRRTEREHKDGL